MKLSELKCIALVEPLIRDSVEAETCAQVHASAVYSSRHPYDREDELAEKLIGKLQAQIDELDQFRRTHKVQVIERAVNQATWMKNQLIELAKRDYAPSAPTHLDLMRIANLEGYEGKP